MSLVALSLLLWMPTSNASQPGNIPASVTWNDIQFNAKKTQCDLLLNKRPCEDYPGLPSFDNKDLERMIAAFPNQSTRPLVSKSEYKKLSGIAPPQGTHQPIPETLNVVFDQIQKCVMGSKSPFIKFVMAETSIDQPTAVMSSNEVMVVNSLQDKIQSLNLSDDEKTALTYFVYAHEFSHFIVDYYARESENHLTASGKRRSDEIMRDYLKLKDSNYINEYERQHYEVDRVAQQILKRCNLPGPSYDSFVTLANIFERDDPSQCTQGRKRAEVLLRASKGR